jgi:hypothetical protein
MYFSLSGEVSDEHTVGSGLESSTRISWILISASFSSIAGRFGAVGTVFGFFDRRPSETYSGKGVKVMAVFGRLQSRASSNLHALAKEREWEGKVLWEKRERWNSR